MKPVADISVERLSAPDAAAALDESRATGPIAWVPELAGWLVTTRDEAIAVLRDAATFTVDDDRFSTAVVVGESMLSVDGPEHARQRAPFAPFFGGAAVQHDFAPLIADLAFGRVTRLQPQGRAELRTELAGPLAVEVIANALGLVDVDNAEVLDWYRSIVAGVDRVSQGLTIEASTDAGLTSLRQAVHTAAVAPDTMVTAVAKSLTADEVFSNTAVLMFGAIETSEGMTANALWHLLSEASVLAQVRSNIRLIPSLIEESLRLEPAAAVVDRYATSDVTIGGAAIAKGDFVRVSLTGANRDPAAFANPHQFDLHRSNTRQHLAFVQGPHVCLGLHMARAQTIAAIEAVLNQLTDIRMINETTPPTGLIFRKPEALLAEWSLRSA